MTEAVGSACLSKPLATGRRGPVKYPAFPAIPGSLATVHCQEKSAADCSAAPSRIELDELELAANYFDCDFLNMRSIFSFVASQQAWLA